MKQVVERHREALVALAEDGQTELARDAQELLNAVETEE